MKPKQFFFVLLGILGVLIAAGGAGYYLASRSLTAGTTQLSQRLADDQLADQRLTDLQDLQKQYERLQPLVPVINKALPQQKLESTVGLQLRNIAVASGMDFTSLSFPSSSQPGPMSQTVKVGDVLALPVSFELSGTYDQLQNFLARQEHLDRYTSVTSLGIARGDSGLLNFSVALNVFVKP